MERKIANGGDKKGDGGRNVTCFPFLSGQQRFIINTHRRTKRDDPKQFLKGRKGKERKGREGRRGGESGKGHKLINTKQTEMTLNNR